LQVHDDSSPLPAVFVVIPAAGSGTRFGSAAPKQFSPLRGRPIIAHTIDRFAAEPAVERIVVAVADDQRDSMADLIARQGWDRIELVRGGSTRQASVLNAVLSIDSTDDPLVAVHDSVRPFFSHGLFRALLLAAGSDGAAVPLLPLSDTIHRAAAGLVQETPERDEWGLAQTPQCARLSLLRVALEQAVREGRTGTDEAGILKHAGIPVRVVAGEVRNLKITYAHDLALAEVMFDQWRERDR
jgi:2-C-methyl-D-erythritol 4-phosphate cytidylyltransferase